MLNVSPAMEAYHKKLREGLESALSVAREARSQGIDPSAGVEIALATDLADRVEAVIGVPGVAERVRVLERDMSREEAALRIGDDFVAGMFGGGSPEVILDHSIRCAMAILTEGVTAAPTEGIAKVGLGRNDDGTEYLKIYYAGPIRSAGGTAQALSVLVGDYVRRKLNINRYIPRENEILRYIEEIRQYNTIMSLQYLPSDTEIRLIIENCPVCIDGEGTEQAEVSGYRDLDRIETNTVRGGMALVIAEGLALKAPKVQKNVKKMKMEGWDWLDTLLHLSAKKGGGDDDRKVAPKDKYLRDLIGGRPVFAYPMRKGGFRLRYGRSRNTGLAAAGLNPATMEVLGNFLAVGTQMKVERPGKAAGISPVDTIEGPTVLLRNGDVVRVDTLAAAAAVRGKVERILDVGEILVSFGEFLENNHPLVPPSYCEEWWLLEGGPRHPRDEDEAVTLADGGAPLHPAWTWFWDDITPGQFRDLSRFVHAHAKLEDGCLALPADPAIKEILEELLVPHNVREGTLRIGPWKAFSRCLGLGPVPGAGALPPLDSMEGSDGLALASALSGWTVRSRGGTRIGGRMGRPGKSKPREMKPPPHALFPLGEAGGSRRSFQEAQTHAPVANMDGGVITIEAGRRRCSACGTLTYRNRCQCGRHTDPVYTCPNCKRETTGPECPKCGTGTTCSQVCTINIREEYARALERLGLRQNAVVLVKGVKGLISRERSIEEIDKGILRAFWELFVFKDGTVRYDMIDLPLTHFRPREAGVGVDALKRLGYLHDIHGDELLNQDQVLELPPQDILVSEDCGDYLARTACFIDDLLEKVYGLPKFYGITDRHGLVGHLVVGLAPHTSAGVLARIVGFSKAGVGYGHPFFHAAKRRNCFHGDTRIELYDGQAWKQVPVRQFIMENFDINRPGLDRLGTYFSDLARPHYARTVDTSGMVHMRKVTSVSVHRAPRFLIRFETSRGMTLAVTPDHAMLVWDLCYLRKIKALEVKEGDAFPVCEGGAVITDRVTRVDTVPCPEERVYCLTVTDEHTVLANGVFTGQCDGDEDCVMLLLDGLLNFSRSFLPETRGGSMDAPLVLSTRLDPKEIDKESHNLDVCGSYPAELYQKALVYAQPKEVEAVIDRVERRLGTPAQLEGFLYTHDTSDISSGPLESTYTQLKTMIEKLDAELDLAVMIRAVDADDVAERVLTTHFIRDLMGNLSAFSKQKFRCSKCNTSYRRMPLAGKCSRCGGGIIPTVHEGSVKKYLEMSRKICMDYKVSSYTKQRVDVLCMAIESTFAEEKSQQMGLADFM
jgi:DNA polymerase II large subunit